MTIVELSTDYYAPQSDGTRYYRATDPDGWNCQFFAIPGQECAEAEKAFRSSIVAKHKADHARMRELHAGVAACMPGWTYHETEIDGDHWYGSHFRYEIHNQTGHSFDLRVLSGADRGKVQVTGNWPKRDTNTPGSAYVTPSAVRESSPSIKCSLDRGYQAIARDIERRFLPEYARIYDLIVARIKADAEYSGRKAENWGKIARSGLVVNPHERNGTSTGDYTADVRTGASYDSGYGDVRMSGDDAIEIKLYSLPVETALRVLRAIKGAK